MAENKIKLKSLKGFNAFPKAFRSGKKFGNNVSIASFCFNINNEEPNTEVSFGVSISKKTAKRAVVRNRIKRLLRESIRQIINSPELSDKSEIFKIVIINWKIAPQKAGMISLDDVKPKVKDLFNQAIKYYCRKYKEASNESNIDSFDQSI